MEKKECLINFLTDLKAISPDWVSGKDHSIISVMKSHGLPLNTKLTTGLIDDLKFWGVVIVKKLGERDYRYKWNPDYSASMDELADLIIRMKGDDLKGYSVGDAIYLMYDNNIQSAKVVESLEDSIVVVFTLVNKGTKSLVLTKDNVDKYSIGNTKDEVIQKIVKKTSES